MVSSAMSNKAVFYDGTGHCSQFLCVHVAVSSFASNRRLLTADSRFDHRAVYAGIVVNNLGLQ